LGTGLKGTGLRRARPRERDEAAEMTFCALPASYRKWRGNAKEHLDDLGGLLLGQRRVNPIKKELVVAVERRAAVVCAIVRSVSPDSSDSCPRGYLDVKLLRNRS